MYVRRRNTMRKLFLAAVVVSVCTSAIMAQETATAGIYGGIQNLRFNAPATSKQDAKRGSAKTAIYGGLQNLNFNLPETNRQDVKSLPRAPKSTFFSTISPEMVEQYAINHPLKSRDAAGGAGSLFQCPPSCPSDDYNRVEIYGGYSLMSHDFRIFGIVSETPTTLVNGFDFFDFDKQERFHLHGGDVSVTVNFTRYIGAQFDFSAHRRTFNDFDTAFIVFDNPVFGDLFVFGDVARTRFRIQNFLFGVQVKDNLRDGPRVRPFGHFLAGFSRQSVRIRNVNFITDIDSDGDLESFLFGDEIRFRRNSFALALGGGFDVRLTDHFSIRPIKFDYLPVFARPPLLLFDPPILGGPDFNLSFLEDVDRDRRTQNNFRIGAGVVFHF